MKELGQSLTECDINVKLSNIRDSRNINISDDSMTSTIKDYIGDSNNIDVYHYSVNNTARNYPTR